MNVNELKGQTIGLCASGGLDSCTTTHWLSSRGVRVVAFTADLGQPDEPDLQLVAQRMKACGAAETVVVDLREEMAERGLAAMQSLAQYEGRYWNTTGLAREVTVSGLLPELAKRGIKVLSHGSTGRGNDQVRFQLITNMLYPDVKVYAPWRDELFLEEFPGREEMLEYCAKYELPLSDARTAMYSTDANLLGLTHEAGELESLETPASFAEPGMGVRVTDAPDQPETIEIVFEKGRPSSIGGKRVNSAAEALLVANEIGGRHGIGLGLHVVENRFIGIKSRGIYEAPGMELLGSAYEFLMQLVLDRRAREWFDASSKFLAKQCYQGYGFDLASQMAWSGVAPSIDLATGSITVELYKGNVSFVRAADVPHSIYIEENASMSGVGEVNHVDSEGFLRVLGQGARATALRGQVRK